jgi:UPF0755 protein
MYLIYKGYDKTLQAGEFRLSPAASAVEIANILQQSSNARINLTVFAGWRLEEVAAAVANSGLDISEDNFIDAATRGYRDYLHDGTGDFGSLEGMLFPGVYTLERSTQMPALIYEMVGRFNDATTPEFIQGISDQQLSLHEAITLASIVEREAIVNEEMALIASVFYNRLRIGMKLESDPTAQYAIGYNTDQKSWWTNPLSLDDLMVSSPYNTYQNLGLPPGPICNPGEDALAAVASPAESDYYFFRASCDGSGTHQFSVTYEEHILNACP